MFVDVWWDGGGVGVNVGAHGNVDSCVIYSAGAMPLISMVGVIKETTFNMCVRYPVIRRNRSGWFEYIRHRLGHRGHGTEMSNVNVCGKWKAAAEMNPAFTRGGRTDVGNIEVRDTRVEAKGRKVIWDVSYRFCRKERRPGLQRPFPNNGATRVDRPENGSIVCDGVISGDEIKRRGNVRCGCLGLGSGLLHPHERNVLWSSSLDHREWE